MLRTTFTTALLLATAAAAVAAEGNGEDAVEGRIRETRVVDGKRYATVSVGTDDGITRGKRLSVFGGRTGREFLGTVEISNAEPGEAVGRVSGPRAGEVRENDRVRAQDSVTSPPRIVPAIGASGG